MISFSQELKARRTKKRLTLREVEERTGISRATLSQYERGIGLMEMSAKNTQVLADFFRWSIKDMLRKMRTESAEKTAQKGGKK